MSPQHSILDLAYYLFFPAIAAFLMFVGFGYFNIFSHNLPNVSMAASVGLAALAVVVVYVLVRHTGWAIYRTRSRAGLRRYAWVPLFLLLFLFSGVGFLTSAMLLFVGPDIARGEADGLRPAIIRLLDAARDHSNDPTFRALEAKVNNARAQLLREIESNGHCGVGDKAHALIAEINSLLTPFSIQMKSDISENKFSCSQTTKVEYYKQQYSSQIDDALQSIKQAGGLADKEKVTSSITSILEPDEAALGALQGRLVGVNIFVNLPLYFEALETLGKSESDYQVAAAKLAGYKPETIASGQLESLGWAPDLLGLIWAQMGFKTAMLCLLALGFDVFASYLVAAVIDRHLQVQDQLRRSAESARVGGKDVAYLWVPVPHPRKTGA